MSKKIEKLADSLQENEIKILNTFKTGKKELRSAEGLEKNEFLRAGMWLDNKDLIKTHKTKKTYIELDDLGKKYSRSKLPELRMLAVIKKKPKTIDELRKRFPQDEFRFAVGYLKQKGYAEFKHGTLTVTDIGKNKKQTLQSKFIQKLAEKKRIEKKKLGAVEKEAYKQLIKRKTLIKSITKTFISFTLTKKGERVINNLSNEKRIGLLKPHIIRKESWKGAKFRRYDVSAPVPKEFPGKKQPYLQFLDDVRSKLIQLGFKEMTGPIVETEFWNFDALFQPQNHPARSWTDTYKLKKPKIGKLPHKKLVLEVKKAHEKGIVGSKGWGYNWQRNIAKKLMPRAHSTAISARQLAKGVEVPGKYFSTSRCYRPDVLDKTHLIEFIQVEGIVIGDLTFKHLLGILKQFALEFAEAEEIKFYPDYYPFTEPSVQISVKHPDLGWIELGGAGIFRPELTKAMGIKKPVLAWGIGIDRLAMCKLGISDIRYLFSQDLNWLRKEGIVRWE